MNERTIIFKQGEENGIVIEREKFNNSIFLNQYQQAINIFQRLWTKQKGILLSNNVNHYRIDNSFSNIIAFCGDRGEGKTSCMSSFATILTDDNVRAQAQTTLLIPDNMIACQQIEWLDTIDPSFFDTKHNLLELLLGRMYAKVEMDCTSSQHEDKTNKIYLRRSLMEHFQQVKKDISMLEKNERIYDSLEEISDLAAGVRLKDDLQKLFKYYLDYQGKECLLICIDDLDLNIAEGYKMAEMIRKYLICPQCIILVAVKVDQLIDIIATAHQKEVKDTGLNWSQCQPMAQKYVTKLLPRDNRVTMPTPTDICECRLVILDGGNNVLENESDSTIKEKIVQMIFQKTGYVFYNTQHLSPIIPKNLRDIRQLLGLLYSLPDARNETWDDDETGRTSFRSYFFNTWAMQLPDEDYKFAQQLAQYDDVTTLNAFVVEHFSKRVIAENITIEDLKRTPNYEQLYLKITSNTNTATNISYGDVMYVLWLINGISLNTTLQNLIFLIKTVYSMRLYAYYNIISQGEEMLYPPTPAVEKIVHIHKAETLYEHVNQLQKLINGSYFTYPQGALLPTKDNNPLAYRDRVIIKKEKLIQLFKNINDIENLKLCEYLALCTSRTTNSKEKVEDLGLNRKEKIPTYLGALSTTAEYLVFDFLQPFYSLSNIEYAYHRFDEIFAKEGMPSLYNMALQTPCSLLRRLYKLDVSSSQNKQTDMKELQFEDKHKLISDAVIRVSDVQWAIFDELLRTRNLHKNGDESIFSAYGDIQKLQIKLYPLVRKNDTKQEAGILYFGFLKLLSVDKDKLRSFFTLESDNLESDNLESDTTEQFLIKLTKKIKNWTKWPRTGKKLKTEIVKLTSLTGTQKNMFALGIQNLFVDHENYDKDYVEKHLPNIIVTYKIAKK